MRQVGSQELVSKRNADDSMTQIQHNEATRKIRLRFSANFKALSFMTLCHPSNNGEL
jgi:hypothetical protein